MCLSSLCNLFVNIVIIFFNSDTSFDCSISDISVRKPNREDMLNTDGLTFPEGGNTQILIPSVLLNETYKG